MRDELLPEARAAVRTGRAGEVPTAEQRARVLAAITTRVSGKEVGPRLDGGARSPVKVLGATAVVSLVAVGVIALQSNDRPRDVAAPDRPAAPQVSPHVSRGTIVASPVPGALPKLGGAATSAAEPPAASHPRRRIHRRERELDRGALDEELALIDRAERAVRDGKPADALVALQAHGQRFPRARLAEEHDAIEAIALCELGHRLDGLEARRRFLAAHAGSPLAARVAHACGEPR